jgi:hypothetical protein
MDDQLLTWKLDDSEPDSVRIIFSGLVTEEADFTDLIKALPTDRRIIIDTHRIRRFDSTGIREWVRFINRVAAPGSDVTLDRCSVPMVLQLNMIANMGGHARVTSLMVPYYCEACGNSAEKLLVIEPGTDPVIAEEAECPSCGEVMEFDDLPESYLAFYYYDR